MDEKKKKQMAKMVDAVQPSCDEEIIAAMTCSHAGSMSSLLIGKLMGGDGGFSRTSSLPNPVFIAVGTNTVYAFKYVPRGFKFKIKKEVARWQKDEISVTSEMSGGMATFVISTESGENHPLEVTILMGAKELVEMFLEALDGN